MVYEVGGARERKCSEWSWVLLQEGRRSRKGLEEGGGVVFEVGGARERKCSEKSPFFQKKLVWKTFLVKKTTHKK